MSQVSVVIPCYHAGKYIDEAIHSILAQTYSDYEIIVVDDGSTDPYTQEKLRSYHHPKLRVLWQENKKTAAARNTGIQAAKSEYILTLDADDGFAPTFLEKATTILQTSPQIGVITCDFQRFGERLEKIRLQTGGLAEALYFNVAMASSLFRKTCWEEVNGYDEEMKLGMEDWEFWIRVLAAGWKIHRISEYLFHYRISSHSKFHARPAEKSKIICTYIYQKHQKLYQKHFWPLVWRAILLLRIKPSLIETPPYPFVLACRDKFPPMLYRCLKLVYHYGLLSTYRVLRSAKRKIWPPSHV